jgi:transcriptional regulator with GAF, ATPase, and Fis domain
MANTFSSDVAARGYRFLESQRRLLSALGGLLMTAMCLTLVLVSWGQSSEGFNLRARWPSLVGLLGLVLIFVLYSHHKHRQLEELERKLRDAAVREGAMQARFTELAFLFDTSTQLQLRLDLASMLELATQRLASCLDASQCSIMLLNPATGMLEVRAAGGVDSVLVKGARVEPGKGIAGHVFASGETLLLTPQVMAERFPDEIKHGRTIASALCVPLRFRGASIGVVSVARTGGEPFGATHARMLETFGEHCAATVVKTEHHQDVLRQVKKVA